jgi:hypothetical protein
MQLSDKPQRRFVQSFYLVEEYCIFIDFVVWYGCFTNMAIHQTLGG